MENILIFVQTMYFIDLVLLFAWVVLFLIGILGNLIEVTHKAMKISLFVSFFIALWSAITSFALTGYNFIGAMPYLFGIISIGAAIASGIFLGRLLIDDVIVDVDDDQEKQDDQKEE
jgi:hypothetical protein